MAFTIDKYLSLKTSRYIFLHLPKKYNKIVLITAQYVLFLHSFVLILSFPIWEIYVGT